MQRATMLASSPGLASLSATRLVKNGSSLPSARRCLTSAPLGRSSLRISAQKDGDKPFKASDVSLAPSFTRRRERAVGRVAMLGVAAAWAGEVLTGLGPISQLAGELGVSTQLAYGVTILLATWQLFLGVNQFNPTWSDENQKDVNRRSKGLTGITAIEPDADTRIKPTQEPGKFLLRNELLLGRSAMLSKKSFACFVVLFICDKCLILKF